MLSQIVLCLALAAGAFAKTSHFKLELTWKKGAPDGYARDMIFINNQFPGPTLDIEQGDWVEVEVCNSMPFNTSIHTHGIQQTNTPWADGVPGLSQRPIQPGATFKYKWYADTYGSYFYHAHSRGQIDDGASGAIIIKPKAGLPNPFAKISATEVKFLEDAEANVKPLLLTDWRHKTSEVTYNDQIAAGMETSICMDSLLVNGKGSVNCLSREVIDASVSPGIAPTLQATGLKLTNKGCLPLQLLQVLSGNATVTNPSVIAPEVFDICTPTNGTREVIEAHPEKKWLALDVISSASIDTFAFSIDEHPMWVFAVDGHYIEPLLVNALTVANGERYSFFIKLDKKGGAYGIRVASLAATQVIDTTAVLTYDHGYSNSQVITSIPYTNVAGAPTSKNVTVFQQAQMVSFPPQFPQPAPKADQTFFLSIGNLAASYQWVLNSTQLNHAVIDNTNPPFLYQQPNANNPGGNITILTKNNTWVDLVFINAQPGNPPHPIHKHSNKGFILGAGEGRFNWSTVAEAAVAVPKNFNLVNPPYRDGFVTLPVVTEPTWLAVRYHVVNPGAFLIHCHIQSHLQGGMAMVMFDGVDEWPEVPQDCKN